MMAAFKQTSICMLKYELCFYAKPQTFIWVHAILSADLLWLKWLWDNTSEVFETCMTELLLSTHSSCGCLQMIGPRSSQLTLKHGAGMGLQTPISRWELWQLMAAGGGPVFFTGVALSSLTIFSGWPHTHTYIGIWTRWLLLFLPGTSLLFPFLINYSGVVKCKFSALVLIPL